MLARVCVPSLVPVKAALFCCGGLFLPQAFFGHSAANNRDSIGPPAGYRDAKDCFKETPLCCPLRQGDAQLVYLFGGEIDAHVVMNRKAPLNGGAGCVGGTDQCVG